MKQIYFYIAYRVYQAGTILGLKKYDPFTISCYIGVPMAFYIISIATFFTISSFLKSDNYFVFVLFSIIVIGLNYYILKRKGLMKLENYAFKNRKNIYKKIIFDILTFIYFLGSIFALYYVRTSSGI